MNESDRSAPLQLLRWVAWAQMKAGEDWGRERDLSREQAFVLGWLVQQPGAIQRDIADATRTTPASVSSLLQGLERRGLLERRTDDGNGRTKRAFVTSEGAALIDGFETAMTDADDRILAPLDAAERAQLRALLEKVTAVLPRPTR